MLLAEELALLLLDDDSGDWLVHPAPVRRAVRIALVVELLGRRRLALEESGELSSDLPATTGGDPLLERVAAAVVGQRPQQLRRPPRREVREVLSRLRDQGALRRGRVRRGRHLPGPASREGSLRDRLLRVLREDRLADRHTALLVALTYELNLLPRLFPDQDVPALVHRAAQVEAQLRRDEHYFPTTLSLDARRTRTDAGDVLGGIGDALDGLSLLVDAGRLLGLPVRVALRVLGELP